MTIWPSCWTIDAPVACRMASASGVATGRVKRDDRGAPSSMRLTVVHRIGKL